MLPQTLRSDLKHRFRSKDLQSVRDDYCIKQTIGLSYYESV